MNILDYIKSLPKEKIYYKANSGNGGDALIAYATYRILDKLKIDYKIVKNRESLEDRIVLYGGGGNLVNYYSRGAEFIRAYHKQVKKLIILPHTIEGNEDLLKEMGANSEIICREETSYSYVSQFPNIGKVYLMDDLALSLRAHDIVNLWDNIRTILSKGCNSKKQKENACNRLYDKRELNCFRNDVEKTFLPNNKPNYDLSTIIYDWTMSNPALVYKNVKAISRWILRFKTINTNRLHICILSAILGKQVNFYSNSYWKNQAIYHYSIKEKFPNVRWMG